MKRLRRAGQASYLTAIADLLRTRLFGGASVIQLGYWEYWLRGLATTDTDKL